MAEPMRIRALEKDGVVDLRVQIRHDMESGSRRNESGEVVPAWYITRFAVEVDGREVFSARLGPGVSRNPLLHIRFREGRKGQALTARWEDSRGDRREDRGVIE
ncbi:MAG: thiosulfate oxidation carrier complex protein SoxZ [Betaproteobacteria bacterium]|nr:thiosulfate oxidation carrier complex protein SoxZ [Betaproteobacteria bacterium]